MAVWNNLALPTAVQMMAFLDADRAIFLDPLFRALDWFPLVMTFKWVHGKVCDVSEVTYAKMATRSNSKSLCFHAVLAGQAGRRNSQSRR